MRPPFWIINSGLLCLVIIALAFVMLSRVKIPKRTSIEPESISIKKETKIVTNIKNIYEKDLFNTYEKITIRPKATELVQPLPTPPLEKKIAPLKLYEPEFLPPLNITLKGIIVIGTNDAKNRIIIQDNTTNQETIYKVGDTVQDAQVIHIFKNKIILLRVTGQQEVLYLREQDAQLDPIYTLLDDWNSIIQKTENDHYSVNPSLFVERVKNLAQFIDLLNITTAYQKGESVGLFIGASSRQSLAHTLGLETRDLITEINGMPVKTTQERLDAYKKIISLVPGDTIIVKLQRKERIKEITYTIEEFKTSDHELMAEKIDTQSTISDKKNNNAAKQQHYAFSSTIDKIKKADHAMIVEKSKISARSMT